MSVAAVQNVEDDGNKDDVTAGDETNKATFSWSGSTLTVTGKGDLSKITVTDPETKLFSALGAGQVYTQSTTTTKDAEGTETTTTTYNAVKKGQVYYNTISYYQPTITYGDPITPSTVDYTYGNGIKYKIVKTIADYLKDDETLYTAEPQIDNSSQTLTGIKLTATTTPAEKVYDGWGTYNGYYYFAIVKGTVEINKVYSVDELKNGDYEIIPLTTSNRAQYCPEILTITSCVDNLYYSSDAINYSYLSNGSSLTYTDGLKLYLGTNTGDYTLVANNDEFFTTNASWLETGTLTFIDYLAPAVNYLNSKNATVIIKTDGNVVATENSQKANINNAITCALVKIGTIETLNLQDTYLPAFVAHAGGVNDEDPSFFTGTPGQWTGYESNTSIVTLYTPCVADNSTLTKGVLNYMNGLTYLHIGEGVETLDEDALSYTGYAQHYKLKTVSFPNSLRYAKKTCMNGQTDVETLTFPAKMASIDEGAFQGTNPKDVYFLGVEAPRVAANAWGENNYISNNAMENAVYDGQEGHTVYVNKETGYTCRTNYNTRNGWMTMLHYPSACSKEQAAKYTDLTRTYKKVVYGTTGDPDIKTTLYSDGSIENYYYEPGLEENALYGNGDITKNVAAVKKFFNIYPAGTYGGNYNGGFDDMYIREQYQWPSIDMAKRSYIVACNDVIWDGKTSIGDGIRKAATSEGTTSQYSGDGKEFIGLHQFVFAQGDVTTDKTDEWDVTKYADGKWHSLCLPFDITKAKLEETFGPDAEGNYNYRVCKFSKVDRTDGKLKLYFNDEQYTKAESESSVVVEGHISYMVKLKKEGFVAGDKVILKDYVMKEGSAKPTNVQVNNTATNDEAAPAADYAYYFIGQYLSGVTIPQYSYFFSKTTNGFRFQTGTTGKWNAYSSVVEAPNGAEDNERYFSDNDNQAKLSTIWDEDETTGIDKVTIEADGEIVYTNDNVYNLNGQLVSTRGLNGLSKGIYIQNGKKFIVK